MVGDVSNQPYKHSRKTEDVDQEWVELIANMGMTKEEIRVFLRNNGS
jgi:hypothetical protein